MKPLLILLFIVPAWAQFGAAKQVIRGIGAPSPSKCSTLGQVGSVYARQDGAAAASTLYVCGNTGVGTYAWELGVVGEGSGTVTSVSVTTANGVSGSVATATSTPAITLTLGAITPTTVSASGAVSGSNLSGINTGDQTTVSGNAGTATTIATPRTINGVSFNGSANITVPAAAGTLTGATLAAGVTASSLTSLGTVATGVWQGTVIGSAYGGAGTVNGVLKANGSGLTSAVTGTATDCVLVNGTSATCGSGGGATSVAGLTDLQATRTSGTVLTIAAGACKIGDVVTAFAAGSGTLSGTSASSTAYGYCDIDGVLKVGHAGATTLTCATCVTVTGVSAFPASAIPLWTATYTSGAWDVSGIVDKRVLNSATPLIAGDGIDIEANAAGVYTITNTGTASSPALVGLLLVPWGNILVDTVDTGAFAANETRWHLVDNPAARLINGIGADYVSVGIGGGAGIRWAIADTAGVILAKTATLTTCVADGPCESAFASQFTLPAGPYYLGITTDSTVFTQRRPYILYQTGACSLANRTTAPKLAGTGTAGSGTAGSVDFGASMGTLTVFICDSGQNTYRNGTHMSYLY